MTVEDLMFGGQRIQQAEPVWYITLRVRIICKSRSSFLGEYSGDCV